MDDCRRIQGVCRFCSWRGVNGDSQGMPTDNHERKYMTFVMADGPNEASPSQTGGSTTIRRPSYFLLLQLLCCEWWDFGRLAAPTTIRPACLGEGGCFKEDDIVWLCSKESTSSVGCEAESDRLDDRWSGSCDPNDDPRLTMGDSRFCLGPTLSTDCSQSSVSPSDHVDCTWGDGTRLIHSKLWLSGPKVMNSTHDYVSPAFTTKR